MEGWTSIRTNDGFSFLCGHRANSINQQIIITGGGKNENSISSSIFRPIRHFDRKENIMVQIDLPNVPAFFNHGAAIYDGKKVIILGGQFTEANQLYIYNPDLKHITTEPLSGDAVSNRNGHSMTYYIPEKCYIIYGGTSDSKLSGDLFSITENTWLCKKIIPQPVNGKKLPLPRTLHTLSVINGKLFMFGGQTSNGPCNQLWDFDYKLNQWKEVTCTGDIPSPRYSHGATVIGDHLLVIGGISSSGPTNDCFLFSPSSNSWLKLPENFNLPQPSGHLSVNYVDQKIIVLSSCGQWSISTENFFNFLKTQKIGEILVNSFEISAIHLKLQEIIELTERIKEQHKEIKEFSLLEEKLLEIKVDIGQLSKYTSMESENEEKKESKPIPKIKRSLPPLPTTNLSGTGPKPPFQLKKLLSTSDKGLKINQTIPPPIRQQPLPPSLKNKFPISPRKKEEIQTSTEPIPPLLPTHTPSTNTPHSTGGTIKSSTIITPTPISTSTGSTIKSSTQTSGSSKSSSTTTTTNHSTDPVLPRRKEENQSSTEPIPPLLPITPHAPPTNTSHSAKSSGSTIKSSTTGGTATTSNQSTTNSSSGSTNKSSGAPVGTIVTSNQQSASNQSSGSTIRSPRSESSFPQGKKLPTLPTKSTSSLASGSPTVPRRFDSPPPRPKSPNTSGSSTFMSSLLVSSTVNEPNSNSNASTLSNISTGPPAKPLPIVPSSGQGTITVTSPVASPVLNLDQFNSPNPSNNNPCPASLNIPSPSVDISPSRSPDSLATVDNSPAASVSVGSTDSSVKKKGFVWKRKKTKKVISHWKLRYLRLLDNNTIQYFLNNTEGKAMGEIDLTSSKVRKIRGGEDDIHLKDNRKWCMEFQVLSPGGGKETIYYMATETEQELNEWLQLIEPITIANQAIATSTPPIPTKAPKKKTKMSFATLKPKKNNVSVEIGSPSPAYTNPNGNLATSGSSISFSSDNSSGSPSSSILHEIIETEKDYVNDLLIVRDNYIKTLEEKQLIQKATKDAIFGNIEELLPIHQQFLSLLTSAYHSPHPDFSDAFELVAPKFVCYSNYCSAQESSGSVIEKLKDQNPVFANCLEEIKSTPECKQLDLASYLIKPMQRICKYPLLLRELLNNTSSDDAQYSKIKNALDSVSQVLNVVNENKRNVDNLMQLLMIQSSIIDKDINLSHQGRRLIKEGVFKKVFYDTKEPTRCTVWLFNDILLVAKQKEKGKYYFKTMMPTHKIIIWVIDPVQNPDKKHGFTIFRTDIKNEKLIIVASSAEEKTEWIDLINDCVGSSLLE